MDYENQYFITKFNIFIVFQQNQIGVLGAKPQTIGFWECIIYQSLSKKQPNYNFTLYTLASAGVFFILHLHLISKNGTDMVSSQKHLTKKV